MAGWAGKTPRGVRINMTYAPPRARRRVYQAACVAALTRLLLAEGKEFCWIYTEHADAEAQASTKRLVTR